MHNILYQVPTVCPLGSGGIKRAQPLGCNTSFLAWIWSPRRASIEQGPKGDPTDSFKLGGLSWTRLSLGMGPTAAPLLPRGGLGLPLLDVTVGVSILGPLGQIAEEGGVEGAGRSRGQEKIKEVRAGDSGGQRCPGRSC